MIRVYAYIRVSTVRQGEKSSSLHEQRDAICAYAKRNGLEIIAWFEEMEMAARTGRQEFNRMLGYLRRGKADGVVLHKIDRGARNLMDWARLCELSDRGLSVHSVAENLDLLSTHGRLSADIQAAVAASYVRNLRDEVKKGIYGRLKQGIYPLAAPIGYMDKGGGVAKEIDPVMGPLMRRAFERYASGSVSLASLATEMDQLGLRTRRGGRVHKGRLSSAFCNPFYIGLMLIKRSGEMFSGIHKPLIPKSLYDRVQATLRGKVHAKVRTHAFLFRRLMFCGLCGRMLTGELQKGRVYYRCHTTACVGASAREDVVEGVLQRTLARLQFHGDEVENLRDMAEATGDNLAQEQVRQRKVSQLAVANVAERLNRLTDAYIDRLIEKDLFESRKKSLLLVFCH